MEVTREVMEKALDFLAESDYEYARLKALHNGLLQQRPTIKAMAFMKSREGPIAQREHMAAIDFQYQKHLEKIELAEVEMLTLQNQRRTNEITIDCWRSLNAARNKGQIV